MLFRVAFGKGMASAASGFDVMSSGVQGVLMIRAPLLSLMLATALCACQQAGKAPPPAPPTEAPRVAAIDLAGDWRVTAIDGIAVEAPLVLVLKADRTRIWWEPICARMGRDYRIDGETIRFTPLPLPPGVGPTMPPPVCAIGPPPRLDQVFVALDAARTMRTMPSGALLIEGGQHTLSLERAKAP
jgi:hypothetical protein